MSAAKLEALNATTREFDAATGLVVLARWLEETALCAPLTIAQLMVEAADSIRWLELSLRAGDRAACRLVATEAIARWPALTLAEVVRRATTGPSTLHGPGGGLMDSDRAAEAAVTLRVIVRLLAARYPAQHQLVAR